MPRGASRTAGPAWRPGRAARAAALAALNSHYRSTIIVVALQRPHSLSIRRAERTYATDDERHYFGNRFALCGSKVLKSI